MITLLVVLTHLGLAHAQVLANDWVTEEPPAPSGSSLSGFSAAPSLPQSTPEPPLTPTATSRATGWVSDLPLPTVGPGPYVTFPVLASGVTSGTVPPFGAWYSYSQAAVPSVTVSADPAAFTVTLGKEVFGRGGGDEGHDWRGKDKDQDEDKDKGKDDDTDKDKDTGKGKPPKGGHKYQPVTREFNFTLQYSAGYPDGYLRRMLVINNQFPGPKIEAVQGDTVVVHVHNTLDTAQSIHWHGIRQNGTNEMDGVAGFSQCPIPPGGSFTYRFGLDGQVGTYWYHSHFGNTLSDGLVGAFIVHAPGDPLQVYDDDRVVYLSDWIHDQSDVVIANIMDARKDPYRGVPFVDDPDAMLINGRGQCNCAYAQRGVPCKQDVEPAEIRARAGKEVRLRLINHAGQSLIRFSVDGHKLKVVEADDTAVHSVWVNEIPVGPGERYSVVLKLDQGKAGDSFWVRARAATFCNNPLWLINGVGILRYTDTHGRARDDSTPTSQPWVDLAVPNRAQCLDLDATHNLVPLIPIDAPAEVQETKVLETEIGAFKDPRLGALFMGWGVDNITYTNFVNNPLLRVVHEGGEIDPQYIASVTYTATGAADLIINNLDPNPGAHPFHLHGRPFFIVARGDGRINGTAGLDNLNTKNPLRRDTLTIPPQSYAVLRLPLDTPGVWPLHCHIGWHLAVGKMAAVVIRPNVVRGYSFGEDWSGLCDGTDPGEIAAG